MKLWAFTDMYSNLIWSHLRPPGSKYGVLLVLKNLILVIFFKKCLTKQTVWIFGEKKHLSIQNMQQTHFCLTLQGKKSVSLFPCLSTHLAEWLLHYPRPALGNWAVAPGNNFHMSESLKVKRVCRPRDAPVLSDKTAAPRAWAGGELWGRCCQQRDNNIPTSHIRDGRTDAQMYCS